jgi:hypothetical protein
MIRDRSLIGAGLVAILVSPLGYPPARAEPEPAGYFACRAIRFFEPCPEIEERGADGRPEAVAEVSAPSVAQPRDPDSREPAVESIWAEPARGLDGRGTMYVPPKPVREFLDAPTPERARAYLAWNQQRLDAIARATEVLSTVAATSAPRATHAPRATPAPGPVSTPVTCATPEDAGPDRDPQVPEPRLRAPAAAPAEGRLVSHGLAVAYAFASWCPHSARQTPIVAAWARSRPDLRVIGLLFDSPPGAERQFDALPFPVQAGSSALRDQLGVRGYPTIVFLRDGVPVEAVSGVTPAARLEAMARGLGA